MSAESHRYDPRVHGDPDAFIDALSKDDPKINLRKSSVLAAAFTPFIKDFKNKVSEYHPSSLEDIRKNVEVGKFYYFSSSSAVSEAFYTEIDDPSKYFSSFASMAETQYLGNRSYEYPLDTLVTVPIGYYEEKFAKATAMTGSVLSELAGRIMKGESNKLLRSPYERTIREETFMPNPSTVLAEGMQTIAAGIGLLTSEGIPGYEDDPIKGMQYLVDQKVFQHFAAQAPTGVIVPMTISGLRFKQPLTLDLDGHVKINTKLNEIFKREKQVKVTAKGKGRLGEGCPVARPYVPEVTIFGKEDVIPESGVQMGMNIFMEYLKYYYSVEL